MKRLQLLSHQSTPKTCRLLALAVKTRPVKSMSFAMRSTGHGTVRRQRLLSCPIIAFRDTYQVTQQLKAANNFFVDVSLEQRADRSLSVTLTTYDNTHDLVLLYKVEGSTGGSAVTSSIPTIEGILRSGDQSSCQFRQIDGKMQATLVLDNSAQYLAFVIHDRTTDTWYDSNGFCFKVPLQPNAQVEAWPYDLCGRWMALRWQYFGRPSRNPGDEYFEKENAMQEMLELVRRGRPISELEQVASGAYDYARYRAEVVDRLLGPLRPASQQETINGRDGDHSLSPAAAVTSPPPPPPPQVDVGPPFGGVRHRNPLDLIKTPGDEPVAAASPKPPEKPLEFLIQRLAMDPTTCWRRLFPLGINNAELLAAVQQADPNSPVSVSLFTDIATPLILHWGFTRAGHVGWVTPPGGLLPEGSTLSRGTAAETVFGACRDDVCDIEIAGAKVPLQRITITLPRDHDFGCLTFVLRSEDGTMWYKDAGKDYVVPLPSSASSAEAAGPAASLADDPVAAAIIEAENSSMWTLMHRFNKAADLINDVLEGNLTVDPANAMARIYVWLRYSATRQLTWQRNYNTQPRILTAAQQRLTHALASAHARLHGEAQEWARLSLSTVGRGGDGQRIRDEILHIMHRNGIPEAKDTWMEQWHQKLHNNTTPDDVPICEAYLAFLESYGNVGAYWRVLSDAGITRRRLETFDRPITRDPEYLGDKRDALIGEFRHYLSILKAVHEGADLHAAAERVGGRLPASARDGLHYVLSHMGDPKILTLIEAAVEARSEIAPALTGDLELLYLDLALEDEVRKAVERGVGSSGFGAATLMRALLQNLALSLGDNEEICFCLKSWMEVPESVRRGGRPSHDDALKAVSVINRTRRAVSAVSDRVLERIGDVSKKMGRAFGCEPWAVEIFAEEVVRGGPAFAVSLVISNIDQALRSIATLGTWQVISPQNVTGVVQVVANLHEVQDRVYTEPTVLIAQQVTGEEEIPEGVVGVLTPDAPDVLSHVSVRARNMRVLFATCHDSTPLEELRGARGKYLQFSTTASGAVTWAEAQPGSVGAGPATTKPAMTKLRMEVPKWCGRWVLDMSEYRPGLVGAKSLNLARLQDKLPPGISVPASVTLPFGCFEQVLEMPENRALKRQLESVVSRLVPQKQGPMSGLFGFFKRFQDQNRSSSETDKTVPELLAECRELAMKVSVPSVLRRDLEQAMRKAGLPVPESAQRWARAVEALKAVWASKYNTRAFYSLRKIGVSFDDVRMAVLVQRVVPAEYAFVIHTKNPSTNNASEVFCEMVLGLGEALVSGMVPGSSVAFKANKAALDNPEVLCYASKSEGMFVRDTLIFRSDSNGEDLEGYAGAGLYDSHTMDPSELRKVDYMECRLLQDAEYRRDLLSRICKLGVAIETALGSPQDIEGVVGPDGVITVVQQRPQV